MRSKARRTVSRARGRDTAAWAAPGADGQCRLTFPGADLVGGPNAPPVFAIDLPLVLYLSALLLLVTWLARIYARRNSDPYIGARVVLAPVIPMLAALATRTGRASPHPWRNRR
jgi:hypothetical protein